MAIFRNIKRALFSLFAAAFLGFGMMSVASAQSVENLLANPKVDDIYAAQLDIFSEADFGDPDPDYGLMRVIRVTRDAIVVVTADTARYEPEQTLSDLKNTSKVTNTDWDFDGCFDKPAILPQPGLVWACEFRSIQFSPAPSLRVYVCHGGVAQEKIQSVR